MMYPFMTLNDGTEIVHSDMLADGRVQVYIEKPDDRDCFHNATCMLPTYEWFDVNGFTRDDIARYQGIIESCAHLIIEFSQTRGFDYAAGF